MAKKTIPITEGRKKLFKIAEEVQKPDTYYVLTVSGKPQVVLMSREEFESIMETIEIMSDPEIVKNLMETEEDFKKGKYVSLEKVIACGVGACQGCVINTKDGYQRVCKDGPVFDSERIIW